MSQTQELLSQKKFHVRVGLAECTVSCQSEAEAIRLARAELNREMPHMKGVIRGIQDRHFRVDQVG